MIKYSYARVSKVIRCLYNRIKAIGKKAMVSALAPATICAQKDPKFAKFGHFLGRYFSRYNFLIKNCYSRAPKLIQCLYNPIKAIGNNAMVSALASATLCACFYQIWSFLGRYFSRYMT